MAFLIGGARAGALLLGMLAAWSGPGLAQDTMEYRVKAAMVLNFTHFISWPDDPGERLVLCGLGDDPVVAALGELDGKQARDRSLVVRRLDGLADIGQCHMLYIGGSSGEPLPAILAALTGAAVATVSDLADFVDEGGMVGLVIDGGKVRFEVNRTAADAAGLRVSSKLLRLARRVVGGGAP